MKAPSSCVAGAAAPPQPVLGNPRAASCCACSSTSPCRGPYRLGPTGAMPRSGSRSQGLPPCQAASRFASGPCPGTKLGPGPMSGEGLPQLGAPTQASSQAPAQQQGGQASSSQGQNPQAGGNPGQPPQGGPQARGRPERRDDFPELPPVRLPAWAPARCRRTNNEFALRPPHYLGLPRSLPKVPQRVLSQNKPARTSPSTFASFMRSVPEGHGILREAGIGVDLPPPWFAPGSPCSPRFLLLRVSGFGGRSGFVRGRRSLQAA